MLKLLLAAILVGTWNGKWFPTGRAEHRAAPEVEEATMKATADMFARIIGTNDVILVLNEVRYGNVASNLAARLKLSVASSTAYRRRDRFDGQQDVILTSLPVVKSFWNRWSHAPRGYAAATVQLAPKVKTTVYAVHLKSNYGASTPARYAMFHEQRLSSVREWLAQTKKMKHPLILAGDFNADPTKDPALFEPLAIAGFTNALSLLSHPITYPSKKYGSSALDHIFLRGLTPCATTIYPTTLSDHFAVFTLLAP